MLKRLDNLSRKLWKKYKWSTTRMPPNDTLENPIRGSSHTDGSLLLVCYHLKKTKLSLTKKLMGRWPSQMLWILFIQWLQVLHNMYVIWYDQCGTQMTVDSAWWLLMAWCWKYYDTAHNTAMIVESQFNSLWPSDAIRRQRSGSTLAQVMACCLTAPSHYLNHCWLIISKVQWHLSEGTFTTDTSAMNHLN